MSSMNHPRLSVLPTESEPVRMHVISKVEEILQKSEQGKILITPGEFNDVEDFLEGKKLKYSYNSASGYLRFYMPSWIHESLADWIKEWESGMAASGDLRPGSLRMPANVQLQNFLGIYSDSRKIPDTFLIPKGDDIWPATAFEIDDSEQYDDLKCDADLLLQGSEGQIGTVVLVKLDPLRNNQTCVQSGFVEIYTYDSESGKSRQRGKRMVSQLVIVLWDLQGADYNLYSFPPSEKSFPSTDPTRMGGSPSGAFGPLYLTKAEAGAVNSRRSAGCH
ncbi:uncharacterized protein KD926_005163 [Aspergillus affinis]|uniref:uncharacterized protein n=1 Tax=Aspergillus affinis TaxID=1070780 RepID=UPI0022FDC49E|nr:uncharacterized protein KD926_005163 [Aspergillus affinis]KAI9034887.1 hypothetical protein KD926_005163 [Aspergillus affinis]